MKELVLYIHGKGGSAAECEHYKPLLPNCEVFGLDYRTFTPWETGMEIHAAAEKLIINMMLWANVTEADLKAKGVIRTDFGEDLSWNYLCYVREHPIRWKVPTKILYGEKDTMTSETTIRAFAGEHKAEITVMAHGEHWFHTDEQMRFLDDWIRKNED